MIIKCYLPIKTKIDITQGIKSNKQGSHRVFKEARLDDTYSVDFNVPTGTPIYSVLDGIVEEVIDKFQGNYSGNDWKKGYNAYLKTNYIIIKHKKGIFSLYHHLKNKGSKVKKGQKVKVGELIGYSGNTGWSFRSHLHFSLFKKTKKWIRKTIPFVFKNYKKSLEDKYYYFKRK